MLRRVRGLDGGLEQPLSESISRCSLLSACKENRFDVERRATWEHLEAAKTLTLSVVSDTGARRVSTVRDSLGGSAPGS